MIYGTLVKIKDIDEDDFIYTPLEWEANVMGLPPIEIPVELSPLKTLEFNSQIEALSSISNLNNTAWGQKYPGTIGLLIHYKKHWNAERLIQLLRLSETGKVSSIKIRNPLWRGKKPVMRRKESIDFSLMSSPAMFNQLYAMLDAGHDEKWMSSFKLEDPQAEILYRWQDENSTKASKQTHSPEQMLRIMKNIVNHTKLPPIELVFIEEGNSCTFSVSPKGGAVDAVPKSKKDMLDGGTWDFLHKKESLYARIGDHDTSNKVVFSGMKITMVMTWAMNARVLIHELAHYFTFCVPTSYRLNEGATKLSFTQYEEAFSGHGSVYMGVYARMLVKFFNIKEKWLYESWTKAGLKFIHIDQLTKESVDEGITTMYSSKRL